MSAKDDFSQLIVAIVETSFPNLGSDLVGKTHDHASNVLSSRGLEVLYQSRTSSLDASQKELYEKVLSHVAKGLTIFLDPIIVSFALKDAFDFSTINYVWLDLEGKEDLGNSVWAEREGETEVLQLMNDFLKNHLEKYVIDAYDRSTREELTRIWEAKINLKECPICGKNSLARRLVKTKKQKLRGWTCSGCGHHVILPSDTLSFIKNNRKLFFSS